MQVLALHPPPTTHTHTLVLGSKALISGNSAAQSVAKDNTDGDVSDRYIPFSGFKPRLNNYITQFWQNEWDSFALNVLHKINPRINEFLLATFAAEEKKFQFCSDYISAIHTRPVLSC